MSQMGYREGTITLSHDSAVVLGSETGWGNPAFVRVGDGLYIKGDDGLWHLVDEIAVVRGNPSALNTELELANPWEGETLEDIPYLIMPVALIRKEVAALAYDISTFTQNITIFISGEGPPDNEVGSNGWGYIDTTVPKFHIKSGGEWSEGITLVGPQGATGPSLQATSTSSVNLTGAEGNTRTWTIQSGRGYTVGQRLRARADASNYCEGTVSSYSDTTLILNVDRVIGSGTHTSWTINVTGDVGPAMDLSIGTVTTGAAGSNASASIGGSLLNRTISLTIPQGAQGIQGEEGPQGEPGAAATISVGNVTTVSHEEPATVTNSGTSAAAVFDFEIPQGEPGISITPRGEYGDSTEYSFNDAVLDNGSTWVYINDTPSTGNAPPTLPTTSNDYWQLSAQRGVDGDGAVNTVNSQSPDIDGNVLLDATDIEVTHAPAEYDPDGTSINDHLAAIDERFGETSVAGAIEWTEVASASTVDLSEIDTEGVIITGTTTIMTLVMAANSRKFLMFIGVLTLMHNGTTNVLPGSANVVTSAGDVAIVVADADANKRWIGYPPRWNRSTNGQSLVTANISPSNDDILQLKSGLWANRTLAQYKADLATVRPSTYTGQVATGCMTWDSRTTTNKQIMSRSVHNARDDITSLQLVFTNWYVTSAGVETDNGNSVALTASVEYPEGIITQVKFSGSGSTTLADGATLVSDAVSVLIPKGAQFWVRAFQDATASAGGIVFGGNLNGTARYAASGLSDLTPGGDVSNQTSSNAAWYGPTAIIATTREPSVLVVGDSIAYGSGDTQDRSHDVGSVVRSLSPYFGIINAARGSDRAVYFVASHTKRVALAAYTSHVIVQHGINDLRNSRTAAEVEADLETTAGYFTGKVVIGTTKGPESSSTDDWATAGNQTTASYSSDALSLNAAIRSGLTGYDDYFDIHAALAPSTSSYIWRTDGDGDSITADGLHPARKGYLLIHESGVVDPARIVRTNGTPVVPGFATPLDMVDCRANGVAVAPTMFLQGLIEQLGSFANPIRMSAAPFGFGPTGSAKVISSGSIAYDRAFMLIDTEGAASTDDLVTMTGGEIGDICLFSTTSSGRDVTIKHNGSGTQDSFHLAGGADFTITTAFLFLLVIRAPFGANTVWREILRRST